MSAPFFSIVTVTLNPEMACLGRTVASLACQTCGDWEHIVKDAGSTNGSLAAVAADPRRRIVVRRDQGIFDAMNQALAECGGRYVLFMNAGDQFYDSEVLAQVKQFIATNAAPIIYTHIYYNNSAHARPYPSRLTRKYLYRQIPCHQALYIETAAYRRWGGFDLSYPCMGDPELLLRFVLRHGAEAKLCPIIGAIFEGGGFSSTPKYERLAVQERRRLQALYFTRGENLRWTLRRWLVLHPPRQWLNRRYPQGPVARLNHWFTSLNNRHD